MGLDTLGGGTEGFLQSGFLYENNLVGSSSSMGIFPGSQLEPEEAPELGVGFPGTRVAGGSTCPGGTGGSPLGFGLGAGSWMQGCVSRMLMNFW